jgi:hypothetical protein
VEDLADIGYGDSRTFALLTLLFPFVDCRNKFHIDHIFPKKRFTSAQLKKTGVDEAEVEEFREDSDGLANLQLLEGIPNLEKQAKLPHAWLRECFTEPQDQEHYCHVHLLGELPEEITEFKAFYETRRERLRERIAQLVTVT